MESVRVVHVGKVVEHVEGKVDVDLVKGPFSLPKLADLLFFAGGFFGFRKRVAEVLPHFRTG